MEIKERVSQGRDIHRAMARPTPSGHPSRDSPILSKQRWDFLRLCGVQGRVGHKTVSAGSKTVQQDSGLAIALVPARPGVAAREAEVPFLVISRVGICIAAKLLIAYNQGLNKVSATSHVGQIS
jgi:hypothetical protein